MGVIKPSPQRTLEREMSWAQIAQISRILSARDFPMSDPTAIGDVPIRGSERSRRRIISADGDRSVLNQLATIRSVRGQVVAVIGTGTAPWTRRNPTELSLHRAHKMGSSRNSAIVTLDMPLHPQNVVRAKRADHGNSR
jgi:hypothetical protein